MHTYLSRLQSERDSLTQTATALAERAATDDRDLTDAESEQLRTMQERCANIDGQLSTYSQQLESQRAYATLRTQLTEQEEQRPLARPPSRAPQLEQRSWGEQFTESAQFRSYHGRGSMEPVEIDMEQRAPILIDTWPIHVPTHGFVGPGWTATYPLLDVCGSETVSTNVVEWFSYPVPYPEASVVPEGTAKPESDYVPIPHTDSLETLAHWKPISRQALEDIPRIQSIIENALRGGVQQKLESLMAAAILADVTILESNDPSMVAAIRIAAGEVQARGYATPNAVLLNPTDFAKLDIDVMTRSNGQPQGTATFWGMRPVPVPSFPEGTAYVGDFKAAATLFSRKSTAVYMTDSHADYFVKNLLVILAEGRGLAAVTEPAAAQKVTTAGAP
jgi:hypothetical protein